MAVVVDILVFPAVAKVAFPGEETDEAAFVDESVALGWFVVVFVDLGKSVGKVVALVVDRVGEGQFDKVEFGEDFFHLGNDEFFESIVVVDMQKTSANEVVAQVLRLLRGEDHVAVACHVEEWIVENLAAAYIDLGVFKVHLGVLVAESDEVGQGGWIGIPVAAATVFEKCDLCLGTDSMIDTEEQAKDKESGFHFFGCSL